MEQTGNVLSVATFGFRNAKDYENHSQRTQRGIHPKRTGSGDELIFYNKIKVIETINNTTHITFSSGWYVLMTKNIADRLKLPAIELKRLR